MRKVTMARKETCSVFEILTWHKELKLEKLRSFQTETLCFSRFSGRDFPFSSDSECLQHRLENIINFFEILAAITLNCRRRPLLPDWRLREATKTFRSNLHLTELEWGETSSASTN